MPDLEDDVDNERGEPGFGRVDENDGRDLGNWRTRYPDADCRKQIRIEFLYLLVLYIIGPLLSVLVWDGRLLNRIAWTQDQTRAFQELAFCYFGGLMGGTLFATKWLYHAVAKGIWNQDRMLWRIFAPLISGALALALLMLARSRVVTLFDPSVTSNLSGCFALGFLIGYFSDNAVGKLSELAMTLFGTATHRRATGREKSPTER